MEATLELSNLIFTAQTDDLERASKVIANLVTDVSKLDKVSRDVAQTEATLAKAAKSNADANLQNAKAQDVRLKSTIAADKADQANEKAVSKTTAATERSTRAIKANADILEYQTDRAKFMAEGFSSGSASILAQAKATGQLSDGLKEILDLQRSFQGNISFDKSDLGIKRLTKSLNEATESQKLFAEGTSLTIEQGRELSRDQNRIAASMKFMGASLDEITASQKAYANEYTNVANAYNRIDAAEKAVIKQRKEVVSATNYVTQADQKMAAALSVSNAGLDKASSDSLVKYETALRKSGMAQELVTTKLATYKTQLSQVQAQEQKVREQHLARALSPQITDIGVSLYSGQAPLTVLLQQSGQILDLFKLSGVEAQNFGKAMRESFYSMIPAMGTVAKGMGSLVTGMFIDAGKAITGFIGNITGISAAMDIAKRAIASGGEENFKYIGGIQKIGTAFSALAGAGIFALVAGLAALAVGLKQVIAQENELNRVVALSGGSMGATAAIAGTYVAQLGQVTGNSTKANEAIIAMAKSGNIASSSVMMVGEAAIALNKAMGTPIEETVKQFAKLATAPSKTLIEIAKASGLINVETVKLVMQYEKAGETAKAAELAQKAYARGTKEAANTVKENYGTLTTFAMGVSNVFSRMWDSILGVGRSDNLDSRIEGVRKKIQENAKATPGLFLTQERIDQDMKDLNKIFFSLVQQRQVQADIGKQKELNVKATAVEEELDKLREKNLSSIEKHQQEITRLTNYKGQLEKDGLLTDNAKLTITKAIASENKKIADELNKNKDKKTESFFESSMKALRNNTVEAAVANDNLVESQVKLLKIISDPAFAKMNETQRVQIMQTAAAAIATEQQAEATKKLEEAESFRLKVLGKSEGVGKQYYSDMEALMKFATAAEWTQEQVEELTRAILMQTPAWKEYEKALEAVNTSVRKFNEDSISSQANTLKENESLDFRLSLLGKTTKEQKALSIENNRANKLREVDIKLAKQLREIEEKIADARKRGLSENDYKGLIAAEIQARKDAAEEAKAINKEVAVQYAEDLQREIDSIKSGITDSIVTALFEGGKAGGKKLREVLVNILRQKVTIVVDAVVNTLLGNVIGSLFGGAASGVAGAAGSSLLGSAAASAGGGWLAGATGIGTAASFAGGLSGTILPAGMVGPSVAAPTLMSGLGSALSAVPVWGWILAGALVFGKKLFGRTLKDTGIQGTFGGESGFEGDSYKFYKGGLFRSDKTTTEKLDEPMRKALGDSFIAMRQQVMDFAKVLGLSTDKLEGFSTSLKLSFKDLDEAGIQKKVQEALATANNELAQQVIGTWETTKRTVTEYVQDSNGAWEEGGRAWSWVTRTVEETTYVASEYAKEGESAIDTLTRLATSLSTVNGAFKYLGVTLFEASLAGADMASALVDAFGSVEAFTGAINYFYMNFYTENERFIAGMQDLNEVFGALGYEVPRSREEFRAFVNSLDLTTEAGRKAYAAVMATAPAFIAMMDSADAFAEAAHRAAEELKAARMAALDAALNNLRTAINYEKKLLSERLEAAKSVSAEIKKVFDVLESAIQSLYGQANPADQTARQGQSFISRALQEATDSGVLPDADELSRAISAATGGFGMENFESNVERRYAQLKLAGELEKLKKISGDQLKDSDYQIQILEDQLEDLDKILDYWEQQVNLAKGGVDATLSVAGAVAAMQSALELAIAQIDVGGDTVSQIRDVLSGLKSPTGVETSAEGIDQLAQSVGAGTISLANAVNYLSGTPKESKFYNEQVNVYKNLTHDEYYAALRKNLDILIQQNDAQTMAEMMIEYGVSLTDAAKAYGTSPAEIAANLLRNGAKVLPQLAVGTNYLPSDMIIQAHQGERIIPKADNMELMNYLHNSSNNSNSTDNSDLIVEVRALRLQNERLEIKLNAIQQNTKITSEVLDQVTEGGNAMRQVPV